MTDSRETQLDTYQTIDDKLPEIVTGYGLDGRELEWLQNFYAGIAISHKVLEDDFNFRHANSWLEEIESEKGRIPQKGRLRHAMADTNRTESGVDHTEYLEALESEWSEWPEMFEMGIHDFAGSDEFRKLSMVRTPPRPESETGLLFDYIIDQLGGEELLETSCGHQTVEVFGVEPHYVLGVEDKISFMENFYSERDAEPDSSIQLGDLHNKGLIGKIDVKGSDQTYILLRKDDVQDYLTDDPNPYTL